MSLDIDKSYMIHFKPLADRRQRILNHIKFDLTWMDSEPENILHSSDYWTYSQQEWKLKAPTLPYRKLKDSEISFTHKHIETYRDIVFNKYNTSLILEDDVILCDNFEYFFNLFLQQTPDDWDFIFIGSGCNLRIDLNQIKQNQVAYKKAHPASKCTDSYCIKKTSAEKILNTIIPFSLPMDWELNYQMLLHDMNVYWWEPPLVIQGSQNGLYNSAIQG